MGLAIIYKAEVTNVVIKNIECTIENALSGLIHNLILTCEKINPNNKDAGSVSRTIVSSTGCSICKSVDKEYDKSKK